MQKRYGEKLEEAVQDYLNAAYREYNSIQKSNKDLAHILYYILGDDSEEVAKEMLATAEKVKQVDF